jgi:hypothetical protein
MRALGPHDILDLSESTRAGAGSRALAVLARAMPESTAARHRGLCVGRRDAELLAIRALTFGERIDVASCCPRCAIATELTLTADDVGLGWQAIPERAEPREVAIEGRAVLLRAVSAGDLADLEASRDASEMRELLFARCVLAVDREQLPLSTTGPFAAAIEGELAQADPCAEIELALTCPSCATAWTEMFDALTLLWSEIRTHAERLMIEVAELARTYHWSERDILALPSGRRRFYLEAARA